MTWTVISIFIVETLVFGLSVLPAFTFWTWTITWVPDPPILRPAIVAMSLVPAYLVFAFSLVALSAFSTKVCGWRTAPDGMWKLRDLEWPLLDWSRYMISTHVVRVLVGTFFRASPLWTLYMRWNGARIGRGVHINSLSISDHNMLEFGDGVVIGENVHLSGHTVEGGMVKTGPVRLGRYRDRGTGQHGRHQRRSRREMPDRRDERGAQGHEARRRLGLRRRPGAKRSIAPRGCGPRNGTLTLERLIPEPLNL